MSTKYKISSKSCNGLILITFDNITTIKKHQFRVNKLYIPERMVLTKIIYYENNHSSSKNIQSLRFMDMTGLWASETSVRGHIHICGESQQVTDVSKYFQVQGERTCEMQLVWDLRSSTRQNYDKNSQVLRTGLFKYHKKKKSVIWGVIAAWLKVCLKCIHVVEQQHQPDYVFNCWALVWCWVSVGFELWGNTRFGVTGMWDLKKSLNDCLTHL